MLVLSVIIDLAEEVLRNIAVAAAVGYLIYSNVFPWWVNAIIGLYCVAAITQHAFVSLVEFEEGTDDEDE